MTDAAGAPLVIAHRGYSARAPENTLAAIELAIRVGASAVEWDVSAAACGTPVLFHDKELDRTTNGSGPVAAHTVEHLKALDAGSWFGPGFEGERIPRLDEALNRVKGRIGTIYCELKGYRDLADVDRVLDTVLEADMADDVTFISLVPEAVDRIRRRNSRVWIGHVLSEPGQFGDALTAARSDPRALLDLRHTMVLDDPSLAVRASDAGVPVAVWTVNDPAEATAIRAAGVSGFTTDEVEALLAWAAVTPSGEAQQP